jgi:PAS domain S-box-containing protein
LKGEIENVNPKFSDVSGYSFEEAFGENPRFLKSGQTQEHQYKDLWKKITEGEEWYGEC